jgi:two-component system NarL family response regulator
MMRAHQPVMVHMHHDRLPRVKLLLGRACHASFDWASQGVRRMVSDSIRVLLVDDHPVVRRGLHSMLDGESGISIVGMASSGEEGILLIESTRPDVVLLDLRMPDMSGVDVIVSLRNSRLECKVLILSNYQLDEDIFNALEVGACGYLLKSSSQEEVVNAIRAVSQGKRQIPPALAMRLAERVGRSSLTNRELEVLELVVQGLQNKEIARKLYISAITARNHVISLLSKLDAKDRTEAAIVAVRRGLVRLKE